MQRLFKLDQRSCDSIGYEFVIENDASKDALEMLIIHSFIHSFTHSLFGKAG